MEDFATRFTNVNLYIIDIDTKEILKEESVGIAVYSTSSAPEKYDISLDPSTYELTDVYGIYAVNNGTTHSMYSLSSSGSGYSYNYSVPNNLYFGDEVMDSWVLYVSHDPVTVSGSNYHREAILTEDGIEARLKFGDSPYATTATVEADDEVQFTSITIQTGMISGSYLSYGDTYSPTCSVEMTKCDYALPSTWFRVELKIDGVWQCFGVFLINSLPTKTSEYISFNGVGLIEGVLEKTSCDYLGMTLSELLMGIGLSVPVVVDFEEELQKMPEYYSNIWIPSRVESSEVEDNTYSISSYKFLGENYRELYSYIATALHANVVERNGVIHFAHLKSYKDDAAATNIIIDTSQYSEEPSDLGYYYYAYPIKVSCQQSKVLSYDTDEETYNFVYMDNGEQEVTIMDQKVTSSDYTLVAYPLTISAEPLWVLATKLSSQYWGVSQEACGFRMMVEALGFNKEFVAYKPLSVEIVGYNPCVYAGSRVAIRNGDSIDYQALCANVTITYDGGISMQIETPCDVQLTGNTSSSGGGSGSSSTTGLASMTSFVVNLQKGNVFENGAIRGSSIADSAITNSKIADSTIEGAKIKDAEIGFEKVDSSFINDLTATDAYLSRLKASVADIDSLTATDAIIKNIQSVAISAEYIRTVTADIGYLVADEADLKYADITFANIDTTNINKANIGLLLAEIGLLDRATIVEGHVTGFLDSVEVNASSITAGTLIADRILLRGSEDSLLFALNNMGELVSENIDSLDGYVLADRTVNADKLVAHSITANEIDVENLFAQDILATGTITGATLKGAYAEIEDGKVGAFSILTDQLTAGINNGVYRYATSFNAGNTGNPSGTGMTVFSYNEETNEMLTYGYLNCNKMQWVDNANAVSFVVDKDGVVTEGKTRLAANKTQGGTLSNYSVQIGSISSNHLNMGARTIQAASASNAAASLYLNSYGGDVNIGKAGSNVYLAGSNMSRSVLYGDSTTLSVSGSTSAQTGTLTDDIKNYKRIKIYAKNNNGYLYSKELYNDGTDLTTTFNVSNLGWLQSTVVSIVANSLTVNLSVQRNVTSSISTYSNTIRYLHVYRVEGYKS